MSVPNPSPAQPSSPLPACCYLPLPPTPWPPPDVPPCLPSPTQESCLGILARFPLHSFCSCAPLLPTSLPLPPIPPCLPPSPTPRILPAASQSRRPGQAHSFSPLLLLPLTSHLTCLLPPLTSHPALPQEFFQLSREFGIQAKPMLDTQALLALVQHVAEGGAARLATPTLNPGNAVALHK